MKTVLMLLAAMTLVVARGPLAFQITQVRVSSNTPFNQGELLYHERQRRLLMVGAYQADLPDLLQLWTWDDTVWKLLPAANGPSMRTLAAAVYDDRRKRVVLYGGLGREGLEDPRGDTWEWDGQGWSRMADTAVGTRDHHTMAYDEARGRTVMYGGASSRAGGAREIQGDTWEWDGSRWTRVATDGPGPRSGVGMVYDRARRNVVLFGGSGSGQSGSVPRFRDTWTWDGRRWLKVSEDGPAGRNGQAMAFDRRAGVVIMWGGTTGDTHLDDMWRWDGRRWTEIVVDGPRPSKRVGAAMVYDVANRRIILYGGRIREVGKVKESGEIWEWNGERWRLMH